MIYLDANVFIFAALNTERMGEEARRLLRKVQEGELVAASSTLSFDELVWAVKRNRTADDAITSGEALLDMPRLKLVNVDPDLLAKALAVMKEYRLDPRDAIHAASALKEDAEAIVSTDKHFDRVKEIERRGIIS